MLHRLLLAAATLSLGACNPSSGSAPSAPVDPVNAGGMVASANPDATAAGLEVLRAGGDAVDAAIAVQTVLSLVEPQSSGIGGGAFMVRYDASTGAVRVYDGRETAPSAADENLFIGEDGEPLGRMEAWRSGLSVGAPGVIAMLAAAHEDHGALAWEASFEPAIALAENGFQVAPRLNAVSAGMARFTDIEERGAAAAYLFDEAGEPWPIGHLLTNADYAESLRAIAGDWRAFYEGALAREIIAAVQESPGAGLLTRQDLASYAPNRHDALCAPYRTRSVCSAPPPSSGGVALGMILGMLERFDMAAHGPDTVEGWHYFIEAGRLAYADRDHYVGDAQFADVPVAGLLDRLYLSGRAGLIDPEAAIQSVSHGLPPGAPELPEDVTEDSPGTSHFVVVDADGDVVSMTTSVESPFGSGRMAGGFFLNNQLTDFAFEARDEAGRLSPNAVAPGKRPRSSMSPAIVLDPDGAFLMATGSPGGNSIIAYTAKTLVGVLDWGLDPQAAANLPNVVARGDVVRIEDGFSPDLLAGLRARGFEIEGGRGEISGIHIIVRNPDGTLSGAADTRRDGTVGTPDPQP